MKYKVKVLIKQEITLNVDADDWETAAQIVDKEVGDSYEDAYYDIVTITSADDQEENAYD